MRFRSKSQPRGVLSGRDQRRLTLLILGVGVVLIAFNTIGNKSFWSGMLGDPVSVDAAGADGERASGLQNDEFLTGRGAAIGQQPINPGKWLDSDAARRFEEGGTQFGDQSRIPPKMLQTVRDDVIGVHSTESDAYYVALRVAQKLTPDEVQDADPASYALFMDAPEMCRGRVWKVKGKIRLIENVRSAANAFGVNSLYDAWVSTPDSGNQLIHVIASSADPKIARAIATGSESVPVVASGVYFKREGYRRAGSDGSGDVGLAPMMLCGEIRFLAPEVTLTTRAEELTPWLGWFAAGICAAVLLIVWQFHASDRHFRGTRTHQLTTLPVRPGFAGVEATSVTESLRQMEEADGAS